MNDIKYFFDRNLEENEILNVLDCMLCILNHKTKKKYLSKNTQKTYKDYLHAFLMYTIKNKLPINDEDNAISYVKYLVDKNSQYNYVRNIKILLKKIFNFTEIDFKHKFLDKRKKDNTQLVFSKPKIKKILAWVEDNMNNELAWLINIIYFTGLRAHEALNLTLDDIKKFSIEFTIIIIGKCNKKRRVMSKETDFWKNLIKILNKYRNFDADSENFKIFCKTQRQYRRLFKQLQADILLFNEPYPMLHAIRRASARNLYDKTKDIFKVKYFLGHENTKTTATYLGVHYIDLINDLGKNE